jgi:hypothetical protein
VVDRVDEGVPKNNAPTMSSLRWTRSGVIAAPGPGARRFGHLVGDAARGAEARIGREFTWQLRRDVFASVQRRREEHLLPKLRYPREGHGRTLRRPKSGFGHTRPSSSPPAAMVTLDE